MFKLLTEEERRKVAHEYAIHRAIVLLCALILVLAIGIIGLAPSYVLSNARQNEVLGRTKAAGILRERKNDLDLQAWLVETNHKLQVLSPTLDTERPSNFIEQILDQRMRGISITSFSLTKVKDKITLLVNGVALDRQSLVAFENGINSSKHFSEVALPVSNLAKDKDIDFQLKFSPTLPSAPTQTP